MALSRGRKAQEPRGPWSRVRAFVVVAVAFLAGCTAASPPEAAAAACPVSYPDGTAAPCDVSRFTATDLADTPPAPATGWLCKDDSLADDGNRYQIWMDATGRLGVVWDLSASPLEGQGVLFASLYQEGADQGLVFAYQDVGFAAFPAALRTDAPFELHILAYSVASVLVNDVDAYKPEAWRELDGWRVVASSWGPDPWFVVNATTPDGPVHLDLNTPEWTEAGLPMTRPRGNRVVEVDGVSYVAELAGGGAKFPARDALQMRANPGFCYLEDLPGAGGLPAMVGL